MVGTPAPRMVLLGRPQPSPSNPLPQQLQGHPEAQDAPATDPWLQSFLASLPSEAACSRAAVKSALASVLHDCNRIEQASADAMEARASLEDRLSSIVEPSDGRYSLKQLLHSRQFDFSDVVLQPGMEEVLRKMRKQARNQRRRGRIRSQQRETREAAREQRRTHEAAIDQWVLRKRQLDREAEMASQKQADARRAARAARKERARAARRLELLLELLHLRRAKRGIAPPVQEEVGQAQDSAAEARALQFYARGTATLEGHAAVRAAWDVYLDAAGERVPQHGVSANAVPSAEWARYQE